MFGDAPAFGAFYARPDPSSGSFNVGHNTRRGMEGWAVKVLWVLEPMSEPVAISGHEVDTGAALMFDPSNGPLSDTLRLDPADPGTSSRREGWTEYPSLMWFPHAGCHLLHAIWADGSWQLGFGIGR